MRCRLPRFLPLVALLAVTALVGTACDRGADHGSGDGEARISPAKVERLVAAASKRDNGFVPRVDCPKRIPATRGHVTYCTAHFTLQGSPLDERVRVTPT